MTMPKSSTDTLYLSLFWLLKTEFDSFFTLVGCCYLSSLVTTKGDFSYMQTLSYSD